MELLSLEWRCFLKAAQKRSVSLAADSLGLPQPTVSKKIKTLETSLGTVLLRRGNRGIDLTSAGEALLIALGEIEIKAKDSIDQAANDRNRVAGTLRLGAHKVVALNHAAMKVSQFLCAHNDASVDWFFGPSVEITRQVVGGELDYGIVANPKPFSGLVIKNFAQEKAGLYCLDGKATSPGQRRLFYNAEMIRAPEHLAEALRILGNAKPLAIADYEIIAKMASVSPQFVGLLPEPTAKIYGLKNLPSAADFEVQIALVYRAELEKTARHKAFISFF